MPGAARRLLLRAARAELDEQDDADGEQQPRGEQEVHCGAEDAERDDGEDDEGDDPEHLRWSPFGLVFPCDSRLPPGRAPANRDRPGFAPWSGPRPVSGSTLRRPPLPAPSW